MRNLAKYLSFVLLAVLALYAIMSWWQDGKVDSSSVIELVFWVSLLSCARLVGKEKNSRMGNLAKYLSFVLLAVLALIAVVSWWEEGKVDLMVIKLALLPSFLTYVMLESKEKNSRDSTDASE